MAKNVEWKKSDVDYSKLLEWDNRKMLSSELGQYWGPITGKQNVESGHMNKIQILGGKTMGNIAKDEWLPDARIKGGENSHLINYICPHCGYSEDGPNIFKRHFDNCIGLIDVFEFNGEIGMLAGTYNNQTDILNDFPTMSKAVLCQAVNGQKKKHHPHYVGGYVVIPRGIESQNS
jgi:hypothetical protein